MVNVCFGRRIRGGTRTGMMVCTDTAEDGIAVGTHPEHRADDARRPGADNGDPVDPRDEHYPHDARSTKPSNGLRTGHVSEAAGAGKASDDAADGPVSSVELTRAGTVGGERPGKGPDRERPPASGSDRGALQGVLVNAGGKGCEGKEPANRPLSPKNRKGALVRTRGEGCRTASDSDGGPGAKRARQTLPLTSSSESPDPSSVELVKTEIDLTM